MEINNIYSQSKDIDEFKISNTSKKLEEVSVEDEVNKSAISVSISMNAQIVLFEMDSQDFVKNNSEAQSNILNFLSGKEVENRLSLSDLGYEGKAITELTEDEAKELISEDGFFGVDKTSQRVADFVFSFSDDDLEIIEKSREGIVKGFEDVKKMWGDELPEISFQTQLKTLELIDERINKIKTSSETVEESKDL